jgi:hypothetical protein
MRERMKTDIFSFDIIKRNVRKSILYGLALWLCLPALALGAGQAPAGPPQSIQALFNQIQASLQKRDFVAYLDLFEPGLREKEEKSLRSVYDAAKMETVRLRLAGQRTEADGATHLFVQAYFENATAALIESWRITASERGGRWEITGKETADTIVNLYKIRIPSDRVERVRSLDISHRDIRLSFGEAAVFHDNIPGLETALLVIGKGTVRFTPSDPIEQHQMELLYGKRYLQDEIGEAYIRCSVGFMSSRVRIIRGEGLPEVTAEETAKAASIFTKAYPRSFTIESSMERQLLSFLPQGEEAVFELKAKRAGELTYIYYPFSEEEVTLYDRSKDRIISLYSPVSASGPRAEKLYVGLESPVDIDRYELELNYSPAASYLSGRARISFIPGSENIQYLRFRFNPDFEILKIYDENKYELFYTQDKLRKLLYVYLAAPTKPQSPTRIEIYYRGRMVPPPPTSDIIGQSAVRNRLAFKPRYETYLFTQAGLWYPAPPDEDYFKARLTLIVPPEYQCVAVGEMVETGRWDGMRDVVELEKAGSSMSIFETRSPVKYLAFIVGKFDRPLSLADPIPIRLHVSTEVSDSSPAVLGQARDILDFYIRAFGPFPYEKLGVVMRLWPTAGGHSPPSFIVLNEVPWASDSPYPAMADNPVNLSQWDDYFLAHEIAHQWWGQGVSYSTYRDQWLSEGLAQFAAASYIREKYGEKGFAAVLKKFSQWTDRKSVMGPISLGSRLSFFDFSAYQAIVYDKAALTLFMLQDLLGKDVFSSGLKEFYETYKFSAARTENFIATMERVSGRDLKDFFSGWFDSYELPEVRTSWSEESTPEGARLRVRITQSRNRFVFPLWIQWTSRGETHDDLVVVRQAVQEFVLKVPGKVDRVRFNPRQAVPGGFS